MNTFVDLAYTGLGLDASGYDIGTARFIDLPPEVFYTICAHHLEHVLWDLYEHWDPEDTPEWDATAAANGFMLFKDWQHMVKNKQSYTFGNEKDPDYQKRFDAIVEWRALRLYNTHRYDHNFDGWKSYLCDASPFFAERLLFKEFPVRLPKEKVLNCYIVAASQSGKTELLKLLAHSIIRQGKEALIFIEPAGDAARQIALWPECKDRLIYVDLSLDLSRAPTVNPFEIYGIKAEDTSPAALDVKTVVAQQLLTAFQEVLGTGAGAELSKNMRTIILPCLMVLLDWPGATIRDLRRFMDDTRNADLVAFAQTRHHYEDVPEFFTHDFHSKHYKDTKNAVQAKLQSLFASGKFARLTCGPSTFMLEKAIEERKIIVFNLAEGSLGELESSAFGRLLVSLVQSIAVRRDKQNTRVPTRVIIDEFHNFTTRSMEKIITQAAKYKLYLTLANQQTGQIASKEIRDAILNVSVLIGGRNSPSFHGPVASMLNVPAEAIGELDRGDFIAHLSGTPPLPFHIHKHLLGFEHRMSDSEWQAVQADQLRRYYRPIGAPVPAQAVPPAERPKPVLAPEMRGKRPPSRRPPVQITEDENIF
jgi:hypothetical protein